MVQKRRNRAVILGAALLAVGVWQARTEADDDGYYGTRCVTRRAYVEAGPPYASAVAVTYANTPSYVRYTRTYTVPTVTYVDPYIAPAEVVYVEAPAYYPAPVRHVRHYYHGVRSYGYGYGHYGHGYRHYGHRYGHGWGFSIGGFGHHRHHGH